MSTFDDDQNVSGNELHDFVTMAMARRTLRPLIPDAPPNPSERLASVLREGLPAVAPQSSRLGRISGRIAGLGVAAKVLLAAGVAVAGAGGAATAVVIAHEDGHHGDGTDSPRNHPVATIPTPTSTDRSGADAEPTAHPTTIGGEDSGHHDGRSGTDGSGSGESGSGESGSGSGDSGSGDSTSGSSDSGSGDSGSGDSGSGSGSTDSGSGSTSDGGSTSGSGDTSGSSGSGSTSGSDGGSGSGSSDGGSTPAPSPTTGR